MKVANIPGKKVEHQGIKVQLLGQIELASERGHPHTFISLGASSSAMAYCWAASASALRHVSTWVALQSWRGRGSRVAATAHSGVVL